MKLFKKKYQYGDFMTENPNDYGIAKYYYKQCQFLEEKCWKQQQEIMNLLNEINHLKLQQPKLHIDDLDAYTYVYEDYKKSKRRNKND